MALYELFDDTGDQGMLVVGMVVDRTFREEADAAGRPDERLVTVKSAEELLEHDSLALAAYGLTRHLTSANSDR